MTCQHPPLVRVRYAVHEQTISRCELLNLVEEFIHRLADALLSLDLSQSQLRIGHEPAFCCDLVLNEIILSSGIANSRPAFPSRVHEIEIVWNQRNEVIDIGVPIA